MKLIIKNPDGSQNVVDIGRTPIKLVAKPGVTYHVVDEKTGKTAVTTVVKRVQDDLGIEDTAAGTTSVEISGFFSDCTPSERCYAVLDTPPAAGSGASEVVITQD